MAGPVSVSNSANALQGRPQRSEVLSTQPADGRRLAELKAAVAALPKG